MGLAGDSGRRPVRLTPTCMVCDNVGPDHQMCGVTSRASRLRMVRGWEVDEMNESEKMTTNENERAW